ILNPIPAGFNAGDWVIIESAYVHYWNARTEVQLRNHTIVPYVPTTVEPDDGIRVDILAFNDFHGRVDPPSRTFVGGEPGAARWAAYAEWLRQENPNPDNVLIFGAGDDFHGGAASNLSIIQGTNVARVFENMGVSHIALGNHEFSFGQERTYTLGQDYDFYLMSACFFYAEGQPNAGQRPAFAKPYDVIEFEDGVVLGVFGLSNPNMRGLVSGGLPNFDIRMPGPGQPQAYSDAIHEIIERLREYYEVDAVVGLTHIGGNHATMNYLADYFDVDALIGGHSHGRINRVRNGVPIIESGQHGNSFGRLSFYFCEDGELDEVTGWLTPVNAARDFGRAAADQDEGVVVTRTTAGFASEAENLAAFESVRWRFEEVEAIVDYWEAIASQILDVEAGPIGVYFDDRTGRDTWITRLLVDYVNRATDQNDWVAVTNTGGWRNTGLWPRDADDGATMRDFQVTMPFNNIILLFEMYGRDLIRLVNRDRPGMMGSYNTGVHRVGNTWYITATNQPITQDGIYNVIGSNFVWNARGANGGDGFPWPGNNFGNEMGMTFINYPRALLWDGTEVVFDNEFTRSSADWESMGLVNLRYSLFAETQWRSENTNWSVGLDVSATASGSAVITSPFAPGDRTATRVASPSWATVQATASGNAEFLGWFHAGAPANAEPVSTALIHSFVIREDKQLEARFYGDAIAVVDRTELKAALDAAALLDAANYTAESWAVLASAVAAGYEVYNNVNATQQAINSAATAIIEAIASLEPEALPPVEFTGSNPNNLLAQLQTRDAVLNTRGNLGIFANHGSFTIPAGRTLTVETALNIHRGAELIVEGTLIIAAGGRLNNQGVGSKITIAYGGELIVYGWVENVSGSTFTSAGEIIINDTARVNIRAGVFFCIEEYGIVTVHSPGILNINRDAIRITEE
ncbi:MAG: metallophosphoesterase, partial [Oscillospiraceae bacterium]|nr:metallophosphoesterase [Oscillospiraceae bacterium]